MYCEKDTPQRSIGLHLLFIKLRSLVVFGSIISNNSSHHGKRLKALWYFWIWSHIIISLDCSLANYQNTSKGPAIYVLPNQSVTLSEAINLKITHSMSNSDLYWIAILFILIIFNEFDQMSPSEFKFIIHAINWLITCCVTFLLVNYNIFIHLVFLIYRKKAIWPNSQ